MALTMSCGVSLPSAKLMAGLATPPTVNDKDMALPPLTDTLDEANPPLMLRCALANCNTSTSWLPLVAVALVVIENAFGWLLLAVNELKLFWSLSAVNELLSSFETNEMAA